MSNAWHYVEAGRSIGPVALTALEAALRRKGDWATTLVWQPGFADWKQAGSVDALAHLRQSPPPVPPDIAAAHVTAPGPGSASDVTPPSGFLQRTKAVVTINILGTLFFCVFLYLYVNPRTPYADIVDLVQPRTQGEILGMTLGLLVTAAIIPLLMWAASRFRAAKALSIARAWTICLLIVGIGAAAGNYNMRQERIVEASRNVLTNTAARDSFIEGARSSCVSRQTADPTNKAVGIDAEQIQTYCDCFAAEIVKTIAPQELTAMAQSGTPDPAAVTKVNTAAATCRDRVFQ